jgi:imidazolonepropionase-like amidohydrolase
MKKTARSIYFTLILASFVLGALASAQGPAAKPAGKIIVHAGKLLDVRTGKTLTDQAIVIDGDKISSVGPFAQARRSADDRLVDLSNATVLPGLTDAHTHLTSNPQDVGPRALTISIPRATLTGARNARITLEAGFTTVRNVGAEGYGDVALRDAINAGDVPGPHMLVSGPALGITGGHCDENSLPFEYHYTSEGVADGSKACSTRSARPSSMGPI